MRFLLLAVELFIQGFKRDILTDPIQSREVLVQPSICWIVTCLKLTFKLGSDVTLKDALTFEPFVQF